MAGILDPKSRVLDAIITDTGRRQIAGGRLKIRYATFSDGGTFYATSSNSDGVANDQSSLPYFQAASSTKDIIILETDDFGELFPYKGDGFDIQGGRFSYVNTSSDPGTIQLRTDELISQVQTNFDDQQIIGTQNKLLFSSNLGFKLSEDSYSPLVNETSPIDTTSEIYSTDLIDMTPVYLDSKFGHTTNFKFLPPVYKEGNETVELTQYANLNEPEIMTMQEFNSTVEGKPVLEVEFSERTPGNNLIGQMFSSNNERVEKLVAVDFGEFEQEDKTKANAHVYYMGNVYRDEFGSLKFSKIFTLVFE